MQTYRMAAAAIVVALAAFVLPARSAHAYGTCGSGGVTGAAVNVKFDPSEYWVWAPPIDPMKPVPLVLALHGDEGTPTGSQNQFWDPVWKASKDFIVVAPRAPYGGGSWWMAGPDHLKWIDKLLADLYTKYNIDIDRIYSTGDSGGSVFLGGYVYRRQQVFAGVQFSCGGGGPEPNYLQPPRADCKTPARFVIATDDFLYGQCQMAADSLRMKGHMIDWLDAPCSGHCCGPPSEYGQGAWNWMKTHTHCGGTTGPGCGMVGNLPGDPPSAGGSGGADGGGSGGAGGSNDAGGSGGKAGNDAGGSGASSGSPSGSCSCRLGGGAQAAPGGGLAAAAALAAAGLAVRRRRRRR